MEKGRGASESWSWLGLEFCDTDRFEVYTVYTGAAPGTRKGGTWQFKKELNGRWEMMVIFTAGCYTLLQLYPKVDWEPKMDRQDNSRKGATMAEST